MAERPEDLNLPITVVQRIIKEALPDGVIVSKEARQTISRASSVFVLYLTACAVTHANKAKRKTLGINDILAAISDMEFDSFIEPLKEALKGRKESIAQGAANKKAAKAATEVEEEAKENQGEEEEEADESAEKEGGDDAEAEGEEGDESAEGIIDKETLNKSSSASHKNKKQKVSNGDVDEEDSRENNDGEEKDDNEENEDDEDSAKSSDEEEEIN